MHFNWMWGALSWQKQSGSPCYHISFVRLLHWLNSCTFVLDLCDLSVSTKRSRIQSWNAFSHTQPMASLHTRSLRSAQFVSERKLCQLSRMFPINTEGTGSGTGCQTCTIWAPSCALIQLLGRFFPPTRRRGFLFIAKLTPCFLSFSVCLFGVFFCFNVKGSNPHQQKCFSLDCSHGKLKLKPSADRKSSEC